MVQARCNPWFENYMKFFLVVPAGKLSETQSTFYCKKSELFPQTVCLGLQITCLWQSLSIRNTVHQSSTPRCYLPFKMLAWIFITLSCFPCCAILTHSCLLVVNLMMFGYVTEIKPHRYFLEGTEAVKPHNVSKKKRWWWKSRSKQKDRGCVFNYLLPFILLQLMLLRFSQIRTCRLDVSVTDYSLTGHSEEEIRHCDPYFWHYSLLICKLIWKQCWEHGPWYTEPVGWLVRSKETAVTW